MYDFYWSIIIESNVQRLIRRLELLVVVLEQLECGYHAGPGALRRRLARPAVVTSNMHLMHCYAQSPRPSVEAIFKKLDPYVQTANARTCTAPCWFYFARPPNAPCCPTRALRREGTGMLTKQGVKEALSQMGLDSSEAAVDQVPPPPPFPPLHGPVRG
jgi:hypothetical protein